MYTSYGRQIPVEKPKQCFSLLVKRIRGYENHGYNFILHSNTSVAKGYNNKLQNLSSLHEIILYLYLRHFQVCEPKGLKLNISVAFARNFLYLYDFEPNFLKIK